MDSVGEFIREPFGAAAFAGVVTAGYIHAKMKLNNEEKIPLSGYVKPALLVALLVYIIVMYGSGKREKISSDPF
jgi:hypothetical protein